MDCSNNFGAYSLDVLTSADPLLLLLLLLLSSRVVYAYYTPMDARLAITIPMGGNDRDDNGHNCNNSTQHDATQSNSPSLIGVLLMVLVYRTGGNEQESFNEITMGNVKQESSR